MRWFAKRFKYTKALYEAARFYRNEADSLGASNNLLRGLLGEVYPQLTKLTYEESREILASCVDYHEILRRLNAADPVQDRVIPIFEKYGIKIERNVLGDVYGNVEVVEVVADSKKAR